MIYCEHLNMGSTCILVPERPLAYIGQNVTTAQNICSDFQAPAPHIHTPPLKKTVDFVFFTQIIERQSKRVLPRFVEAAILVSSALPVLSASLRAKSTCTFP